MGEHAVDCSDTITGGVSYEVAFSKNAAGFWERETRDRRRAGAL